MRRELLTRTECNLMRGIAILGIFLHNYCHWLGPMVKENEYQYFQHNVDRLNDAIIHPDIYLPMQLLSFFGHYGVPIFLFLSAYGLTMKYSEQNVGCWDFVRYHFLKLFRMMIVGFVAFTMLDAITPGSHHYRVADIAAQLFLVNNLMPDPDHVIWPGPYWFFGLMLQLYAVYILFIHKRNNVWLYVITALCVGIQLTLEPESAALNWYRYNFMGGMMPFTLGIVYARHGKHWVIMERFRSMEWLGLAVAFLLLTYVLSLNFGAWNLAPAAVCAATVCWARWLTAQRWTGRLVNVFAWLGSISAALFVCHPITRKIFIPISKQGDLYTGLLLYIIASICLAWLFRSLLRKVPNPSLKTRS